MSKIRKKEVKSKSFLWKMLSSVKIFRDNQGDKPQRTDFKKV